MPDPKPPLNHHGSQEAAELIRAKIAKLYTTEPNAKTEIAEEESLKASQRSKHQAYMHELNHSGRSLAEIQTAWHQYYASLPDEEKHEVWREFYATHAQTSKLSQAQQRVIPQQQTYKPLTEMPQPVRQELPTSTVSELKNQLLGKVQSASKHRRSSKQPSHLHSIAFGFGMGSLVVLVMLFSFFNERFIAPFITPSKTLTNTAIITDPNQVNVGSDPKLVIPKINLEVPVVYDVGTIDEPAVEEGLKRGVVHYATTPNPGEKGNGVIFGHSSNNILNSGRYKFAFVLLKRLEVGDTFYVQKDGKRYVYKVFDKQIVEPTNISVLDPRADKPATFTLITCDPPGTSLHRLVVTGEQISPDPGANTASTAKQNQGAPSFLPSNAPTLWHRLTSWITD